MNLKEAAKKLTTEEIEQLLGVVRAIAERLDSVGYADDSDVEQCGYLSDEINERLGK